MNATTMQTFTGKLVDLANFTVEDVRLPDIAHALACINRFTGHSVAPYSVAQHSVMVSRLCDPQDELWGLMHDASEAYLGDVARPLKAMLPDYVALEQHVQQTIGKAFGLAWPMPKSVKVADNRALIAEKRALMSVEHDWGIEADPVHTPINPYCWQQARQMFENRFKEIVK
jgi:5'-deoxynucleotidase YfbR-like HD superfamily hydrolase